MGAELTASTATPAAGSTDVTDRAGRLLGQVSVPAGVDVTDRAARALGVVASVTAPVDMSDRAGRLLGVIASIAATITADVSDRAGRALGVVASITAPVDVSDRAGRLVGVVDTELPAAAALSDAAAQPVPPAVGGFLMLFNQTLGSWFRGFGNTTRGMIVDGPQTFYRTAVSAANGAITLTLAAPGAGNFWWITSIKITRVSTAALAGAAILTYTTTQLSAAQWVAGNAMAAGDTKDVVSETYFHPIRSDTANTAVTFVAPAGGAAVSTEIIVTAYSGPLP